MSKIKEENIPLQPLRTFDNRALKMNRKHVCLNKISEIRLTKILVEFVSLTYTKYKHGSFGGTMDSFAIILSTIFPS